MERHCNIDLRLCVFDFHCTVHDVRTVRYLGLNIRIDSLTLKLMLASFCLRYLAEAQDDINVLLELMKIVT